MRHRGPFRWRFNQGDWSTVRRAWLLDSVQLGRRASADWISLGTVELTAGEHEFEIRLLVSPRINLRDEQQVVDAALRALRETGRSSAFAAAFWEQAGSLRMRRAEPVWNMGGKFAPLYVAERVKRAGGR